MSHHLSKRKTLPCVGCNNSADQCNYAHSLEDWVPSEKCYCQHGSECYGYNSYCYYLHDHSLEAKDRFAKAKNMTFRHTVAPAKPALVEVDPRRLLQMEKAILLSEYQALMAKLKLLEVRMRTYRRQASEYWEAGSAELEFQ